MLWKKNLKETDVQLDTNLQKFLGVGQNLGQEHSYNAWVLQQLISFIAIWWKKKELKIFGTGNFQSSSIRGHAYEKLDYVAPLQHLFLDVDLGHFPFLGMFCVMFLSDTRVSPFLWAQNGRFHRWPAKN